MSVDHLLEGVQSGALVFMKGSTFGGIALRISSSIPFTHVGILVRRYDEWWLLECTPNKMGLVDEITQTKKSGVVLSRLIHSLNKHYYDYIVVLPVRLTLDAASTTKRILDYYANTYTIDYNDRLWNFVKTRLFISKPKTCTKGMFCSNYAASVLEAIDVLKSSTSDPSACEHTVEDLWKQCFLDREKAIKIDINKREGLDYMALCGVPCSACLDLIRDGKILFQRGE